MTLEHAESQKPHSQTGDGQHYANLMSEVNASRLEGVSQIFLDRFTDNGALPRPSSDNHWSYAELDFGRSEDLYGQSKSSLHPFTPQEIAAAGKNEAVMLNEYQAMSHGPSLAFAGDRQAPQMPDGFGLVMPDAQDNQITSKDGPAQVRDNIRSNSLQFGSAGVDQYLLPDCTFESSLSSLANTVQGRQEISQMITQNKDGSYEVTFPGAPNKPVDITANDLNDPRIQDSAGWAKILEAANLKLNPEAALPNKRSTQEAMFLLTGHRPELLPSNRGPRSEAGEEDEALDLQSRLRHGEIVVAQNAPNNAPTEDHHAYSVLGVRNDEVLVRNPWGVQFRDGINRPQVGGTKDGVTNLGGGELEMSISTFNQDFHSVISDQP